MKVDTTYQLKNDNNLLFHVLVVATNKRETILEGQWVLRNSDKLIGYDKLVVTKEMFDRAFESYK